MKNFLFFFFLICASLSASAQCSIDGNTNVFVENQGTSENYSISQGFGSICVGDVSLSWDGDALGTFSSVSCTGFTIDFTPQIASSFLVLTYTAEPEPGNFITIECDLFISTTCTPNTPISTFSNASCGSDETIFATIQTDNEISSFDFSNLNNLSLLTNSIEGGTVFASFELLEGCSGGSFTFNYSNSCGESSTNHSLSLNNDKFVGSITGVNDICTLDGPQMERYRVDLEDYDSDCVSVKWFVSPSSGAQIIASGEDSNSPYVDVLFTEVGTYTVNAVAIACGEELTNKLRKRDVLVCDDIAFLPGNPPLELQNICFDDFGTCYDFSGFCFSDLIVTSSDPKLLVGVDGSEVCLYDILGKQRESVLSITPVNACGAGETVHWRIFMNNPRYCGNKGEIFLRNESKQEFTFDQNVLSFEIEDLSWSTEMQVQVFDVMGRVILDNNYTVDQRNFELPEHAKGILIARISVGDKQYVKKFFRN